MANFDSPTPLHELDDVPEGRLESEEKQVIWISVAAARQIEGDEGWYKSIKCCAEPSRSCSVRTIVPKAAVAGGVYHPDRDEDIYTTLEWCEVVNVPGERAEKRTDRTQRLLALKKGDEIVRRISGGGMVIYERDEVIEWRDGVLYTNMSDTAGFGWEGAQLTPVNAAFSALHTTIIFRDEVPNGEEIS